MANALDGVPVVVNEGKYLKFQVGDVRTLTFVGMQEVEADRATIDKGFANKEGKQIQLEFSDAGVQKFYYAKDGSSKLIQALKSLASFMPGDVITITKKDEYNFGVVSGTSAAEAPVQVSSQPF